MNWVQFKDPLLFELPCLCGTVVAPLSLTEEIVGSDTAILLFYFFSVQTFRKNAIVSKVVVLFSETN